jgi:hypothetical protein
MGDKIVPLATGTLKLSRIRFYCSPSRTDGLILNLGVMAEILVPRLRGLGLVARQGLTPFEMERVSELGRRLLASPFDLLSEEFDIAWKEASPGRVLDFLRERHHHSLRFESPEAFAVPHRLFVEGQPVKSLVRAHFSEILDEEGLNLVPRYEGGPTDHSPPPAELVELRPAARELELA